MFLKPGLGEGLNLGARIGHALDVLLTTGGI